jgi:hypothetical protein
MRILGIVMETHLINIMVQNILVFLGTVIASSGFWMWMIKKLETKDISRRLLIGLAHDRIIYLSMKYMTRGSITQDEYENLCMYLYEPYKEIGGNGAAKRLMAEVDKLPIMKDPIYNNIREKGEKGYETTV